MAVSYRRTVTKPASGIPRLADGFGDVWTGGSRIAPTDYGAVSAAQASIHSEYLVRKHDKARDVVVEKDIIIEKVNDE